MAAYPLKPVEFNGEDICSLFQAGQNPSTLGRSVRKVLFGEDGLTMHMMVSESSQGRKEAPTDYTPLFESKNESIVFSCLVSCLVNCLVDFLLVTWSVVLLYCDLSSCSLCTLNSNWLIECLVDFLLKTLKYRAALLWLDKSNSIKF